MVVPRPPLPPARPIEPAPRQPPAPQKNSSSGFPTPMNFSFNRPATPQAPVNRATSRAPSVPGTLDFSLAPRAGATDNSPFSLIAGANLGPDWRNELSAWVRAHAYYPEQAAMNDEDGDVTVRVSARPDGHVTSVELEHRSLSRWLDLALLSMFRDANLPPLHQDEGITFRFTMHYILIRSAQPQ
jgi:TonB family protein